MIQTYEHKSLENLDPLIALCLREISRSSPLKDETAAIHTSTAFCYNPASPTDLVILSSDGVFFSVYKAVIMGWSQNLFGGRIENDQKAIVVTETSEIMNLVLYAFYNLEPAGVSPSTDELDAAFSALEKYGLPISLTLSKGKPFHSLLFNMSLRSMEERLDAFSLATKYGMEELAVEISQNLISVPLHHLTEEQCSRMGALYLRRLTFLHLGRTERLKMLLSELPGKHTPNAMCDVVDQRRGLEVAWRSASNVLCWDAQADTSPSLVKQVLETVLDKTNCEECKLLAKERIRKIILDWSMVKSTI